MKKRILVCVKLVPADMHVPMDREYRLERDHVSHELNLPDMAAVECALSLGGEVTVLTMGTGNAVPVLWDLLARGAYRAVLLTDGKMAGSDTRATSVALAAAQKREGVFDLVICGRRAMDGETGQVPAELAVRLGFPCVTNVIRAEWGQDGCLACTRLLEEGEADLEVSLPAVISVAEYSYSLRLPSIRGRRQAAEKEVEVLTAEDLGLSEQDCGLCGSRTRVIRAAHMEMGFRFGKKERNVKEGVKKILEMIGEDWV